MATTFTSWGSPGTVSTHHKCETSEPYLFAFRPKLPYQHLRERAKKLPKATFKGLKMELSIGVKGLSVKRCDWSLIVVL